MCFPVERLIDVRRYPILIGATCLVINISEEDVNEPEDDGPHPLDNSERLTRCPQIKEHDREVQAMGEGTQSVERPIEHEGPVQDDDQQTDWQHDGLQAHRD